MLLRAKAIVHPSSVSAIGAAIPLASLFSQLCCTRWLGAGLAVATLGAAGAFGDSAEKNRNRVRHLIPMLLALSVAFAAIVVADFAFYPGTSHGSIHPLSFAQVYGGWLVAVATMTALFIRGAMAVFARLSRCPGQDVLARLRAARSRWLVPAVVAAVVPAVLVWEHAPIATFVLAALVFVTAAAKVVALHSEIRLRTRWLDQVLAGTTRHYRVVAREQAPFDPSVPALNAPTDDCDGVVVETSDTETPYRGHPRAIAFVRR